MMADNISLRWLGCAGFRIEYQGVALLLDPWISRNPWARPPVAVPPEALWPADAVLVGHGHFDHAADLPDLARGKDLPIYAEGGTARLLESHGVAHGNLRPVAPGWKGAVGPFGLRAHPIEHVFYGLPLMVRTLYRIGLKAPRYLPLALNWPCGQALAWRVEVGGRSIVHMGTAGATPYEVESLATAGPVDLLLVALQGNDKIHEIAAGIVDLLKPAMVIPHHHDDFYPPISAQIPVAPFADLVTRQTPGVRVHELNCGETFHLSASALNNRVQGA
jgi:L-ascorbate metabolism protein UlaG (beta-lactamase superfamily)